MSALTEDDIEFRKLSDEELIGYTPEEAYAFLAGIGSETSTTKMPQVTIAAKNVDIEESEFSANVSPLAEEGETMPWEVRKQGEKFCVVKILDNSVVACHDSADKARAQVRALYASESAKQMSVDDDDIDEFSITPDDADFDLYMETLQRESDVNLPVGGSHNLREYWVHGAGAAKIRWGTEGDGTRCIKHLRKYVRDPGGLCQEYHQLATGKSMHPHPGRLTEADELEEFHGTHNQKSHGNWAHPPGRSDLPGTDAGRFAERVRSAASSGNAHKIRSMLKTTDMNELDEIASILKISPMGDSHDALVDDMVKRLIKRHGANAASSDTPSETKRYIQRLKNYVTMHGGGPDVASKLRKQLASADDAEINDIGADLGIRVKGDREDAIKRIVSHLTTKGTYMNDMFEFADNPDEPYGDVKYADPGYQADGRKRYPIDTPDHIRAAWAYINMPRNSSKYSSENLKKIKDRIKKAMSGIGAEVQAAMPEIVVVAAGKKMIMKDCPPGHHRMPDGDCMPDAEMTYADEPWEGVLTIEGEESGDGRMFSSGSLDWAEVPLPLLYQPANTGGHNGSIIIGDIQKLARRGNEIWGRGKINGSALAGEHGDGIRTMMQTGGVSVDVDRVKDADVELVYGDDGEEAGLFSKPEMTIFNKGRIRGATLVAYPAFVEAQLNFVNEVQTASAAEGDCGCSDDEELFTASAHTITIPDLPPREWFDRPNDVKMYGALTVTDEGRVFGRLAPANVTHRNVKRRVPMSNVDYSRWMNKETIVEGGDRVVTGVITGNCGHAATNNYGTLANRKEHYDNSCSIFANVRIGEDADGVWVAGALRHGVTSEQVATMLGCQLSGDWQPHPDRPGISEFIAALLVPVPGFPMARTRPSVNYNDGMITASSIPVRLGDAEPPSLEEQAREAIRIAKMIMVASLGLDPHTQKQEIMARIAED
jgi:hypothetical protein